MDMRCPYCDTECEVCHDDGAGYSEDEKHRQWCGSCDKQFIFTTAISFDYYPEKADCLNDGEHDWQPTVTWPIEYTKGECSICELRRTATEDDMATAIQNRNALRDKVASQ